MLPKPAAKNLPHGDQAAWGTSTLVPTLAVHESHEAAIPLTTLAIESICWLYSLQTIDDWGASKSAEWYMWGADWLMISKNSVTKRRQSEVVLSRVPTSAEIWI